jgi:hypothetical protein
MAIDKTVDLPQPVTDDADKFALADAQVKILNDDRSSCSVS